MPVDDNAASELPGDYEMKLLPWKQCFARMLVMLMYDAKRIIVFQTFLNTNTLQMPNFMGALFTLFTMATTEPILISCFGTTQGKV